MKNNPLKPWMGLASAEQQQALADEVCGGSRPYLYHWANGHREPGPAAAKKMEEFTAALHGKTGGALPIVWRVGMVEACSQCEFAQACLKGRTA